MSSLNYIQKVKENKRQISERIADRKRQGGNIDPVKLETMIEEARLFLEENKEESDKKALMQARYEVFTQVKNTDIDAELSLQTGLERTDGEGFVTKDEEVSAENSKNEERPGTTTAEIGEDTNTKTGEKIYTVKLTERVSNKKFKELITEAYKNHGYYFQMKSCFVFKTREDAEAFSGKTAGEKETKGKETSAVKKETAKPKKTARKKIEATNKEEKEEKTLWKKSVETLRRETENKNLLVEASETNLTVRNKYGEILCLNQVTEDPVMAIIMPYTHEERIGQRDFSYEISSAAVTLFQLYQEEKTDERLGDLLSLNTAERSRAFTETKERYEKAYSEGASIPAEDIEAIIEGRMEEAEKETDPEKKKEAEDSIKAIRLVTENTSDTEERTYKAGDTVRLKNGTKDTISYATQNFISGEWEYRLKSGKTVTDLDIDKAEAETEATAITEGTIESTNPRTGGKEYIVNVTGDIMQIKAQVAIADKMGGKFDTDNPSKITFTSATQAETFKEITIKKEVQNGNTEDNTNDIGRDKGVQNTDAAQKESGTDTENQRENQEDYGTGRGTEEEGDRPIEDLSSALIIEERKESERNLVEDKKELLHVKEELALEGVYWLYSSDYTKKARDYMTDKALTAEEKIKNEIKRMGTRLVELTGLEKGRVASVTADCTTGKGYSRMLIAYIKEGELKRMEIESFYEPNGNDYDELGLPAQLKPQMVRITADGKTETKNTPIKLRETSKEILDMIFPKEEQTKQSVTEDKKKTLLDIKLDAGRKAIEINDEQPLNEADTTIRNEIYKLDDNYPQSFDDKLKELEEDYERKMRNETDEQWREAIESNYINIKNEIIHRKRVVELQRNEFNLDIFKQRFPLTYILTPKTQKESMGDALSYEVEKFMPKLQKTEKALNEMPTEKQKVESWKDYTVHAHYYNNENSDVFVMASEKGLTFHTFTIDGGDYGSSGTKIRSLQELTETEYLYLDLDWEKKPLGKCLEEVNKKFYGEYTAPKEEIFPEERETAQEEKQEEIIQTETEEPKTLLGERIEALKESMTQNGSNPIGKANKKLFETAKKLKSLKECNDLLESLKNEYEERTAKATDDREKKQINICYTSIKNFIGKYRIQFEKEENLFNTKIFREQFPNAYRFTPAMEKRVLLDASEEERGGIKHMLAKVEESLKDIPTKSQKAKGMDQIVHAHYFTGGTDVFVLDIDSRDENDILLFTYTILNADYEMSEYGYQSVNELASIPVMELDLHWEKKPLGKCLENVNKEYYGEYVAPIAEEEKKEPEKTQEDTQKEEEATAPQQEEGEQKEESEVSERTEPAEEKSNDEKTTNEPLYVENGEISVEVKTPSLPPLVIPEDFYLPVTDRMRLRANIEAINTLKTVEGEGREPSNEERLIMARYTGWGGLGGEMNDYEYLLAKIMTEEEKKEAELSTKSAYYTPYEIIDKLWEAAQKAGYRGGTMLESSAGIGNVLTRMPKHLQGVTDSYAVEIDSLTGRMLEMIHPEAHVEVKGFEKVKMKNNSIAAAITNVPFITDFRVHDTYDKDLSDRFRDIHNFFIAKNVRKLQEGGVGVFITSSTTLDRDLSLVKYITNEGCADFIGAFRLNRDTFQGAGVTTDILVIKKRKNNIPSPMAIDLGQLATERKVQLTITGDRKIEDKTFLLTYNKYYLDHPECMGGKMYFDAEKGNTRFGGKTAHLYPESGISQMAALDNWVKNILPTGEQIEQLQTEVIEKKKTATDEGELNIENGELYKTVNGTREKVENKDYKVNGHTQAEVLQDYKELKKAVNELIEYEKASTEDDERFKTLLREANRVYDIFTMKYGYLTKTPKLGMKFLRNDPEYASICTIENYSEETSITGKKKVRVTKGNILKERVIGKTPDAKITSLQDAIIVSVNKYTEIRVPYVIELLNKAGVATSDGEPWTDKRVRDETTRLELGFINPVNQMLEVRHQYLSGNVREKLRLAVASNDSHEYDTNIKCLEEVQPLTVPIHLIEITLGSSWVPNSLYEEYVKFKYDVNVKMHCLNGRWIMEKLPRYELDREKNIMGGAYSAKIERQYYGTDVMMSAINNTVILCRRKDDLGVIVDKQCSELLATKKEDLKEDFKEWIRDRINTDQELADNLEKTYNEQFNSVVPMKIDDIFIPESYEGQNTNIKLREHQKQAVARSLIQPVMFAHEVGAGKTFALIASAMEMKRIGTAQKPMIVVQNATLNQFIAQAKTLYPAAKICNLDERDNNPEGRRRFFYNIRNNDWDLIIIQQSVLDKIPDAEARKIAFKTKMLEDTQRTIDTALAMGVSKESLKDLVNEANRLQDEINNGGEKVPKKKSSSAQQIHAVALNNEGVRLDIQLERDTDTNVLNFDEIGVDALLIDEAHYYKHLGFTTTMTRGVKGIDPSDSKKSASLYMKIQAVKDKTGGKNIVMATGTPISNTAAEIWTFMKYLCDENFMRQNGIDFFDNFAHNYGNINTSLEFATNGKFKENTRFASYVNVPELMRLWCQTSHTVLSKNVQSLVENIPETHIRNYNSETGKYENKAEDIFIEQNRSLVKIMRTIKLKLEEFENMSPAEKKANRHIPLVMYGLASKAAIDVRLVDPQLKDEEESKTNKTVEKTIEILNETESYKGTVAIFADKFQHHDLEKGIIDFNLFNDIKQKLVAKGVPEREIVIMISGMSQARKEKIFEQVNSGEVRVIMGSTSTLGTGVNIQERLNTVIHIDAPVRPMDYTQRNGRLLRQGNLHKQWNKPVKILRYGVTDTLDITSYQRLKIKNGFIQQVMEGGAYIDNNQANRVLEEEEEGTFDNPVAQLSGSEYALLKQMEERKLKKLINREKSYRADQIYIANRIPKLETAIATWNSYIEKLKKGADRIRESFPDGKVKTITINGVVCKNETEVEEQCKLINKEQTERIEAIRHRESNDGILQYEILLNDVKVNVTTKLDREENYDFKAGAYRITVHREMKYESPDMAIEGEAEKGYIANAIKQLVEVIGKNERQERLDEAIIKRDKAINEKELLSQRQGRKFENEEELEKTRKKVEELTKLMKEELHEKELKYQAMLAEDEDMEEFDITDAIDQDIADDEDEEAARQADLLIDENPDEELLMATGDPDERLAKKNVYYYIIEKLYDAGLVVNQYSAFENENILGMSQGDTINLKNIENNSLETPIHEYAHLWCAAMRSENPELWKEVKETIKNSIYYNEILNDENYKSIREDEDRMVGEAIARISGKRGAKRMFEAEKEAIKNGAGKNAIEEASKKVKNALRKFWGWTSELLFGHRAGRTAEEIADRVLYDLIDGKELKTEETIAQDVWYEKERIKDVPDIRKLRKAIDRQANDALDGSVARDKKGALIPVFRTNRGFWKERTFRVLDPEMRNLLTEYKDTWFNLQGSPSPYIAERLKEAYGDEFKKANTLNEQIEIRGLYFNILYGTSEICYLNIEKPYEISEETFYKDFGGKRKALYDHLQKMEQYDGIVVRKADGEVAYFAAKDEGIYNANITDHELRTLSNRFRTSYNEKNYLIIGQKGAAALDDLDGTHRLDDLRIAKLYDNGGRDAAEIKAEHYWEKAPGGEWMFETPLKDFSKIHERINNEEEDGRFLGTFTIGDLPELEAIYPGSNLEIEIDINPAYKSNTGEYHVTDEDGAARIYLRLNGRQHLEGGIIHECQHFAQEKEGFTLGTSIEQIEKDKAEIAKLLNLKETENKTWSSISASKAGASEENSVRVDKICMAYGMTCQQILLTPSAVLYRTNYGEQMAFASTKRTLALMEESDYANTLLQDYLLEPDLLWKTEGDQNTMNYLYYVDPEDVRWEYEQRKEEAAEEPAEYNARNAALEETIRRIKEQEQQLKEELISKSDPNKEYIRFYVPLTEEETQRFIEHDYTLPPETTNPITTEPQSARNGAQMIMTIDLDKESIEKNVFRNSTGNGYIIGNLPHRDFRLHSTRQMNEPKMRNYERTLFQRVDERMTTRRALKEQTETLVKAIEKVFPREMQGKVRILNEKEFAKAAAENYSEETVGITTSNGEVLINADRARTDTPLHELGIHRMMDIAIEYGIKEIDEAIRMYGETAPDEIKYEVERRYPEFEGMTDFCKKENLPLDIYFAEEIAAMAIGLQQQYRIEEFLQKRESRNWYERLTDFVTTTLDKMKRTILGKGYADLTPLQCLDSLGHEAIGNRLFQIIMDGKPIKTDKKIFEWNRDQDRAQVIGMKGIRRLALDEETADSQKAVLPGTMTIRESLQQYDNIKKSEKAGNSNYIRCISGMFLGPIDRKPRMELEAPSFVEDEKIRQMMDGKTVCHLKDLLQENDTILKAYPELKDMEVIGNIKETIANDFANIQKEYVEEIDESKPDGVKFRISIYKKDVKEWKESVIHEIQHAIQTLEGFEEGYPFTTPLSVRELEFLRKNAEKLKSTQLKELATTVTTSYLAERGMRAKALPTIKKMLSYGSKKLLEEIKRIEKGLKKYTFSAGENEAYAIAKRMYLARQERLARPLSEDYFVSEDKFEPSPINQLLRKTKQGTTEFNLFNNHTMLTFAQQRERISILEIAQYYGYKVLPRQGMRVPILEHDATGDKIAILNPSNPAQQGFFTIGDDSNKGTLYNFIASRVSMGIIPNPLSAPESENVNFVVNKVAHDYLNIPIETRKKNQEFQQKVRNKMLSTAAPTNYEKYCEPLTDTEFLKRRGLDDKTIGSDLFKERIFTLNQEELVKDGLQHTAYGNNAVAFPLWNADGDCIGLEQRSDKIKLFVTGSRKAEGVWHSNIPEEITDVVICETPLDAIAYHQLKGNETTLYVATGGNVCTEQINQVNEILRKNKDKIDTQEFTFHLANDNDKAGANFNLQYVKAQLRLKQSCSIDVLPAENGMNKMVISYATEDEKKEMERKLGQWMENNKEKIEAEGEKIIKIDPKSDSLKTSVVLLYRQNDMFALSQLSEALIKEAPLSRTKIEHAITKDFNDDLMALNYINKTDEGVNFSYEEFKINKEIFMQDVETFLESRKKPTKTQERQAKINDYIQRHKEQQGGVKM